jgi:dTDP-4-dehydrorhamnose 3,5-epimerase
MAEVKSISSPRRLEADWPAAHQAATEACEPVFVPVHPHADDRGWSLMNLLAGALSPLGQINYSLQYPGVVKAWHRHQRQTDFWICVHGQLKAGIHREDDGQSWSQVMGEAQPGVLIIPPLLWHGATTLGPHPAGLLYYMSNAYDPAAPDEQRRAWDSVPGFAWACEHR